jgi:hypothetical protein
MILKALKTQYLYAHDPAYAVLLCHVCDHSNTVVYNPFYLWCLIRSMLVFAMIIFITQNLHDRTTYVPPT